MSRQLFNIRVTWTVDLKLSNTRVNQSNKIQHPLSSILCSRMDGSLSVKKMILKIESVLTELEKTFPRSSFHRKFQIWIYSSKIFFYWDQFLKNFRCFLTMLSISITIYLNSHDKTKAGFSCSLRQPCAT